MGCPSYLTAWEEPTPASPCCLCHLWTRLPSGASQAASAATGKILKGMGEKKKKREMRGMGWESVGKEKLLSECINPEHAAEKSAFQVALSTFEIFLFTGGRWYVERENK